jgi:short-subunit dehydrogenase
VIVVTGGTSGIGLATARMAAQAGARLVLAARDTSTLDQVRRDLESARGQVETVVADVGRQSDVDRIADAAIRRFGGFDTWVNNAGTSVFARLQDLTDADARRLFDTNFWGVVYGSVAAVKHLKSKGGALLNVGSVLSDVAVPVQGMYVATKHAVAGYTDALRLELEAEHTPVSVTLIRPSSIDTPFPQRATNYFDREPKLPPPVYTPQEVAAAILHAAEHPERDVYVGTGGRVLSGFARQFPETFDLASSRLMPAAQFRDEPARRPVGTLHAPAAEVDGQVRGEHPGPVLPLSLSNRVGRHPLFASLLVVGAGLALAGLLSASVHK